MQKVIVPFWELMYVKHEAKIDAIKGGYVKYLRECIQAAELEPPITISFKPSRYMEQMINDRKAKSKAAISGGSPRLLRQILNSCAILSDALRRIESSKVAFEMAIDSDRSQIIALKGQIADVNAEIAKGNKGEEVSDNRLGLTGMVEELQNMIDERQKTLVNNETAKNASIHKMEEEIKSIIDSPKTSLNKLLAQYKAQMSSAHTKTEAIENVCYIKFAAFWNALHKHLNAPMPFTFDEAYGSFERTSFSADDIFANERMAINQELNKLPWFDPI